jgi:hypothetical protein
MFGSPKFTVNKLVGKGMGRKIVRTTILLSVGLGYLNLSGSAQVFVHQPKRYFGLCSWWHPVLNC